MRANLVFCRINLSMRGGTKAEASASKRIFAWKKATENHQAKLHVKVCACFKHQSTVFGGIKSNWSFEYFALRGLTKATYERGLVAPGHSIRKIARAMGAKRTPMPLAFVHILAYSPQSVRSSRAKTQ